MIQQLTIWQKVISYNIIMFSIWPCNMHSNIQCVHNMGLLRNVKCQIKSCSLFFLVNKSVSLINKGDKIFCYLSKCKRLSFCALHWAPEVWDRPYGFWMNIGIMAFSSKILQNNHQILYSVWPLTLPYCLFCTLHDILKVILQ